MNPRLDSRAVRCVRGPVVALVMLAMLAACATPPQTDKWRQWDIDFDEGKKPWREIEGMMPSYPRPEHLVPLEGRGTSQHRFFIDAQSLSVGDDGVVRYTLLVNTTGGATNVSFEGIRCETREQKFYALGRADGSWARARSPQWRYIEAQSINRHHIVLYAEIFCDGREPVATAREVLQRLKYGASAR